MNSGVKEIENVTMQIVTVELSFLEAYMIQQKIGALVERVDELNDRLDTENSKELATIAEEINTVFGRMIPGAVGKGAQIVSDALFSASSPATEHSDQE